MIFTAHSRTGILFSPSFLFSLSTCLLSFPSHRNPPGPFSVGACAERTANTIWPRVAAVVGGSSSRGALWEKMATAVRSRVVRALPMSRKCHWAQPDRVRFREENPTFFPHTLGLCVNLCSREGDGELELQGGTRRTWTL